MCVSLNVFASSCCIACVLIPGLIITESLGYAGEQYELCGRISRCPQLQNGSVPTAADSESGRASMYASNFVLELVMGLLLVLVVAPLVGIGGIAVARLEFTKKGCCCRGSNPACCCGLDAGTCMCDMLVHSLAVNMMVTCVLAGLYVIVAEATLEYVSDIYMLQTSIGVLVILATCLLSTAACCACGASAISMTSLYSCFWSRHEHRVDGRMQPRGSVAPIPQAVIVEMRPTAPDCPGGGAPTIVVAMPIRGGEGQDDDDLPVATHVGAPIVTVTAIPRGSADGPRAVVR
jgi:hypothetical protein